MPKHKQAREEIIKLFRSGKFSIATDERGCYRIMSGRYFEYDDMPDKGDYQVNDGGTDDIGYMPAIVVYLVEALGGTCDSI